MYVCGPTTYAPAHIGHAYSAIAFDTVRRALTFLGWDVTYVRNVTDIDDKIIKRAAETGQDPLAMSAHFAEEYRRDMARFNVMTPSIAYAWPFATSRSTIAMTSLMCVVTFGSIDGVITLNRAMSRRYSSAKCALIASGSWPVSAARLMILSSMSVTLRTYVTSQPRSVSARRTVSNAIAEYACPICAGA